MTTALIVLSIKEHFNGSGRSWPMAQENLVPKVEKHIDDIANALDIEPITLDEFNQRATEFDNAIIAGSNKANILLNTAIDFVKKDIPVIVAKNTTLNNNSHVPASQFEHSVDRHPKFAFVSRTEDAIEAAQNETAFIKHSYNTYLEIIECHK